jgi:hypothetical protein
VVAGLGWCLAPLGLSVHALRVLGEPLTHLCLQECESIASECDSSALHREDCIEWHYVFELQTGGACYSWRLPPPRRLGGLRLRRSLQEDCARLLRSFVRGIVLTLRGSQRATLVERVIELPHLMVGSCGAL